MKKKISSLEDLGGFVYSTNDDFELGSNSNTEDMKNQDQELEAHLSKKGRGGKTVTLIKGFKGTKQATKDLTKLLKTKIGVGGSSSEKEIIIQGNNRDKIMDILKKEGFKVKRVGG